MRRIAKPVEQALYRASEIVGLVGEAVLGGIVLLIVVDIILRYGFNRPLAFSLELVEFGLCLIVFLAIAVCTAHRGHVNIDIFLRRFPKRGQAAINSFIYFLATGIFGLMVWGLVIYAMWSGVSIMLKLPYQPFILWAAFCILLTCLLFLSQFIHFVVEAVRK